MARLLHELRRAGSSLRANMDARRGTLAPPRANHEEIHARLESAMASARAAGRTLEEQERIAGETAAHFASVAEAYRLRREAVETVMPASPSPAVLTLAGTARRMHSLATERGEMATAHLSEIRSRREKAHQLLADLVKAQAELRLAVTVEQSRLRLDGLGGLSADVPAGPGNPFDIELREATRLAREAEALAELKGGWA